MITEGNFVMFKEKEDETCVGRVEYVMTTPGVLGLADSEYAITSTEDDYGVLIRVYEEEDGVWEEEDKLVTRNISQLTPVGPLKVERDVVVLMGDSVSEDQYKSLFDGFGKDYSKSSREIHQAPVTKEETN